MSELDALRRLGSLELAFEADVCFFFPAFFFPATVVAPEVFGAVPVARAVELDPLSLPESALGFAFAEDLTGGVEIELGGSWPSVVCAVWVPSETAICAWATRANDIASVYTRDKIISKMKVHMNRCRDGV